MHITQKEEQKKLKDVIHCYGNLKSGRAETRKAKTICGNAYYPSEIYLIFGKISGVPIQIFEIANFPIKIP